MDDFVKRARSYFETPEQENAKRCLVSYLNEYSGAWFLHFSDRQHPIQVTEKDILAVSMLGVAIPANASIWILRDGKKQISDLLESIPNIDIWDPGAQEDLATGSRADRLWDLLLQARWPKQRADNDIGPVIAGKLMAAKRPNLVPIWDHEIANALRPPKNQYWSGMWHVFQDRKFRENVNSVGETAASEVTSGAPMPGILRIFDIVVWMRSYGAKDSSDERLRSLLDVSVGG